MKHEDLPKIDLVNTNILFNQIADPTFAMRQVQITNKEDSPMSMTVVAKAIALFAKRLESNLREHKADFDIAIDKYPPVNIYIGSNEKHNKYALVMIVKMEELEKHHIAQLSDVIFLNYLVEFYQNNVVG